MKKAQPFEPHTVGERIGHARRLLGVRLGRDVMVPDLAEMVRVSAAAAYNWESGTSVPAAANLERLAEVLGVSAAWLHYGVNGAPVATGYERVSSAAAKAAKGKGA